MKVLETERTSLVTVEDHHVAVLAQLWQNQDVRLYLGGIVELDVAFQKVLAYVGQETHRTVFRRGSDEILGIVMLTPLEEDMEISYLFFPEYWGLGYAKEASSRLIRFGFETLGCKQIFAVTQTQNLRSVKLLESLGMRLCETFIEFSAEQSKYRLGNPFLSVD